MPRDFTANSFKFSPDAINALVKHCRETTSNGRWRDDDPRSRGLWIYVGARGANYEQRTRKEGKYVSRKQAQKDAGEKGNFWIVRTVDVNFPIGKISVENFI